MAVYCLLGLMILLAPPAAAQTLYWDIDGTTAGAGGSTPAGNWRTSGAGQNWGTLADGTSSTGYWVNGSVAVFSAGSDATGSFTVTVNSVTADSIFIEEGNITFNSSTITLNGSTPGVDVAAGLTATFNSRISGTDFVKSGEGVIVFQGSSKNYTGTTHVNAGTLRLGASNVIGNASNIAVASGAIFDLAGNSETFGSLSGAGTVTLGSGTLTIDGDGETTEFSGSITGSGNVAKTGTDTLILSGASDYTGTTSVTAGVLNVRHSQALGSTAAGTTVSSGEALELQGTITIGAEALSITGSGVSSAGALRNISGANTYGGVITLTGNTTVSADAGSLTLSGGVSGSSDLTLNGAGDFSVAAITTGGGDLFINATGTVTLTGANTFTGDTDVNAGTLRLASGATLGDSTDVTVASGATFDLNGQTDTVATIAGAGNIHLGAGSLTSSSGSNATFSGVMSGTGSFTKAGTGTLSLSGANTYAGETAISAGTLRLLASDVLADSTDVTIASGATLNLNGYSDTVGSVAGAGNISLGAGSLTTVGDADTAHAGVISGSGGSLTKQGAGTLTLSGTNTYSGATIVGAGTLQLGADNVLSDSTAVTLASGATLNLAGYSDTVASIAGADNISLGAGSLTAGGSDASTEFSGVISGSGGFTKTGGGTLTLSGASTYAGVTAVSEGVVVVAHATALGTTDAGTTVTAGEALHLQGNINVGAESLAITGTGSGGTGALRNLSGHNTWAGAITLDGNTTFASDAGSLSLSGGVSGANRTLTLIGDGDISIAGIATGTGALVKNDTGTATLTGTSTYTGATTVNTGTLRLGSDDASAAGSALTVAGGATFAVNGHAGTVASITGDGSIDLEGGSLATAGSASTTFAGAMSGSGSFSKGGTGTLTLTGANSYNGETAVNAGILRLGEDNTLATATTVTVASGATFDVNNRTQTVATITGAGTIDLGSGSLTTAGSGSTTFSGVMSGSGSFTKDGAGTLTLSGNNSYSGATTVAGGTLELGASNVLSDATAVTVGAGATLDLASVSETVATLAGTGTVQFDGGSLTTTGNDATTFSGDFTGDGTFTKAGSGVLTLESDLSFEGTFNLAGGTLRLSNIALNLGTLAITGNSIIDFAGSSSLNLTDFSITEGVTLTIQNWADLSDYFFTLSWNGATFNVTGSAPMSQITFSGFSSDDTKWQEYDRQVTPVPEPSAYGALLLAVGGGIFAWRRRRLSRNG